MNKKIVPLMLVSLLTLAGCSENSSSPDSSLESSEQISSSSASTATWNAVDREVFDDTMDGHYPPVLEYDGDHSVTGYDYSDDRTLLYDYITAVSTDDSATYSLCTEYASLLEAEGYEDIATSAAQAQGRYVYEIIYSDGVYVQAQVYLKDSEDEYITSGYGAMSIVFYSTISDYADWNEDVVAGYISDCLGSDVVIPEVSDTGCGVEIYDWIEEYGCVEIGINTKEDLSGAYLDILKAAGWEVHFQYFFTNGLWMDPTGEIGLFFGQAEDSDNGTLYPYFYIDIYNVSDSFIFSQQKVYDLFYDYINVTLKDPIPDPTNDTNKYVYYDDSYLYYNSYYDYDLLSLVVEGDITSYYGDMLLEAGYIYDTASEFYISDTVDIYFIYAEDYGVSNVQIYFPGA